MSKELNEFTRVHRDCQLGMKAFQNIRGALESFDRLLALVDSSDHVVLIGVFQAGVIRYAKPFLNVETETGLARYRIRHLKSIAGFSTDVHDHLLELRNTLIAHDDFEQVEPRLLILNINANDTGVRIPMSITVANKCLGYPADISVANKLREHVAAALDGVQRKLYGDLDRLRQAALDHPDQAKSASSYSRHMGQQRVEAGGSHFVPPDYSDDPWLQTPHPDYSALHNGYHYEEASVRREFFGPQTIRLPNGETVVISPSDSTS